MAKYIDAEKLIAEIKRRRLSNQYIDTDDYEDELFEIITALQQEQPEVEFETEYAKFSNDPDALDYAFPIDLADYKDFARHFYELGLNARKEETK